MSGPVLHLSDDACAGLVLGLVDGPARAVAEAHARSCVECEARLRAHAGANLRARADLAGAPGLHVIETRPRKRNAWIGMLGAAAAIAAVVFIARGPAQQRHVESRWLTSPGDFVRVRGDQPMDDALRTGFEAYARHDVAAAIAAFQKAHASDSAEQARRLYLGHALLTAGRAAEARVQLESVDLNVLPQPWRDEARHALAMAWRATGDGRRADSLEGAGAR